MNVQSNIGRDRASRFIAILRELINLQEDDSRHSLFQFQSLASASQYLDLYDLLTKNVPANSRLLDWGCGNSHFSYASCSLGYQTTGFAFDSYLLQNSLKEKSNYQFIQGDIQEPIDLPFSDESFDTVTSIGVLEHVRETGGNEIYSLKEIARVLQNNGYFICYHLPNQFRWIECLALLFPAKHHHSYRYTRSQITSMFNEAGFEIIRIYRYGILPRNILSKLPKGLNNNTLFTKIYNFCDKFLSVLLSLFCQNYAIVARKN
jgi:SAM-dependent methyltransferase